MGLLRELLPTAVRIGLLVNPTKANVEGVTKDVTVAGPAIGVQTDVIAARDHRSRPRRPRPQRKAPGDREVSTGALAFPGGSRGSWGNAASHYKVKGRRTIK